MLRDCCGSSHLLPCRQPKDIDPSASKESHVPMPNNSASPELSLRQNMLWNALGSLSYLGCQWLITVLVVRLSNGFDAAGVLSLAMSVYNIFSPLAIYRMRTYQVSDVNHEYSVGEYLSFRMITCALALFAAIVYSTATCPSDAFLAILSYMIYKTCSLLIDVLHGLNQQKRRMDYIGKSLMLQGIASLFLFFLGLTLFNDVVVTFLVMALGIAIVGFAYDLPRARHFEDIKIGIAPKRALHLLRYCFPIVVAAIACAAVPSIPRQYLSFYTGTSALGIYASVAAPVAIVQMGANYIYNPLLGYFSEAYKNKEFKNFGIMLTKASLGIGAVGFATAIALKILGEPLLILMFGRDIAVYTYLINPMIICALITGYVWFLNDILVSLRDFKGSLVGNSLSAALSIPATLALVPLFGMNGVSFSCILSYGLGALAMLLFVLGLLRKGKANGPSINA